jgi:aminoglycoside phosphotransferase (APT) family kinase protein
MGGAVFYLMEPVDGFNATVALPPLHAGDPAIRHAMGLQAADAIARLGAVDHVAVGLADFGKPDGFLERQVGRWMGASALSQRLISANDSPSLMRCRRAYSDAGPTVDNQAAATCLAAA